MPAERRPLDAEGPHVSSPGRRSEPSGRAERGDGGCGAWGSRGRCGAGGQSPGAGSRSPDRDDERPGEAPLLLPSPHLRRPGSVPTWARAQSRRRRAAARPARAVQQEPEAVVGEPAAALDTGSAASVGPFEAPVAWVGQDLGAPADQAPAPGPSVILFHCSVKRNATNQPAVSRFFVAYGCPRTRVPQTRRLVSPIAGSGRVELASDRAPGCLKRREAGSTGRRAA